MEISKLILGNCIAYCDPNTNDLLEYGRIIICPFQLVIKTNDLRAIEKMQKDFEHYDKNPVISTSASGQTTIMRKLVKIVTEDARKVNVYHPLELTEKLILNHSGYYVRGYFETLDDVYQNIKGSWVHRKRVWDWKLGAPKIHGLIGPMRDTGFWRYEDNSSYDRLSI